MKMLLETERLLITEFTTDDAAFILKLVNSPAWLQYIGDRQIHTLVDAKQYLLNGPIKGYRQAGFGFWKIMLKNTSSAIGMCGFVKRDYLEDTDIGYALLPGFEGCGYAYEAAAACLAYGGQVLQLGRVAAIVQPGNTRSIQLLKKLGLHFQHVIIVPDSGQELQLFNADLQLHQ